VSIANYGGFHVDWTPHGAGIGGDEGTPVTREYQTALLQLVRSSDQKVAKDFLRWICSKEIYDQWFTSQQGFSVGSTKAWENHPLWQIDPVILPFHTAVRSGRFAGYAGPSRRPAAEAISKYILVDMYAKAVQGMAPADAVKWADGELVKIYA
jgi:multiple sugar transport system substrate-binding protein